MDKGNLSDGIGHTIGKVLSMMQQTEKIIYDLNEDGTPIDRKTILSIINEAEKSYEELIEFLENYLENTQDYDDSSMENYLKASAFIEHVSKGLEVLRFLKERGNTNE